MSLNSKDYQISIIMPALNEEQNIGGAVQDVVDNLRESSIQGEIIVVNDGSTDETPQIVSSLSAKYPFIRMITHETPKGIGASFWRGVQEARGEIVTLVPGDGEIYCAEVLRYLPLMKDVDVLVPFIYNREVRTWQRRLISKLYKAIINVSFGLLLNYMNGTVIYRRVILEDMTLRSPGFFYQTELLIKTLKRGYLFAEVPCALKIRTHGASTALKPKSFYYVIKGYLQAMLATYVLDMSKKTIHPGSVTYARRKSLLRM